MSTVSTSVSKTESPGSNPGTPASIAREVGVSKKVGEIMAETENPEAPSSPAHCALWRRPGRPWGAPRARPEWPTN